MDPILNFVRLSKYAGQRWDLVQAGGGNTSVKLGSEKMVIKKSGLNLSELEIDKGHVAINYPKLISFIGNPETVKLKKLEREKKAFETINSALLSEKEMPSIETLFHALLGNFVLHTHPIVVNAITCRKEWKEKIKSYFGEKVLFLDYFTPGIDLAIELHHEKTRYQAHYGEDPHILFLKNHGLIVSASSYEQVIDLNEKVIMTLETECRFDFSHHRLSHQIASLINSVDKTQIIVYPSQDAFIEKSIRENRELFFHSPVFPDYLIYCGVKAVEITSLTNPKPINDYKSKFKTLPKLLLYGNQLFIVAPSVRKAKDIEDVLKSHLLILKAAPTKACTLPEEEIHYLLEWEAEKYRQKV